ncbi:hypothetical protein AK830_g227 [Neonectria ditissima]|uniref:Phosphoribosyltransferase domain-containing protein n=1 Tax=Neonectria ditissima TaxID=78410 RepID=A0A0P7C3R6_9HYPO|nr:hypothetical protein AK830_g227 [Neonectria ditissima]
MSENRALPHPSQALASGKAQESQPARSSTKKPVVVGLYGVPGSGKSFLLNRLKEKLGQNAFEFYEGSKVIDSIVPGGLTGFGKLSDHEKLQFRQQAIQQIGTKSLSSGKVAVVAGHFMFWSEHASAGWPVYTASDLDTFTYILYLDVPAETVAKRRRDDTERMRPAISVQHVRKWQEAEKTGLRQLCRQHGILFSLVSPRLDMIEKVSALIRDFQSYSKELNLFRVEAQLDGVVPSGRRWETVLVLDGDKTLTESDTGTLFWQAASKSQSRHDGECPLSALFGSPLGYSERAFRQATLLYEEASEDDGFEALCETVASAVTMHPEFVSLLRLISDHDHIGALVVTCGLRRVWEMILDKLGFAERIKVIGNGRIADGMIVTAAVKAAIVTRLQASHQTRVWAFGDSPNDLLMLEQADEAVVIVGDQASRSRSMDAVLANAIDTRGLQARQCLLPGSAPPRLDGLRLPQLELTDQAFIDDIIAYRRGRSNSPSCSDLSPPRLRVLHATERNAAKFLMTPTRNASVSGPDLRAAHDRVGWYLANEFLSEMVGVEEYAIPHVQGHETSGYRLCNEEHTSIVALMRGGEPMALGVNRALPLAMFIHAACPADIKPHHVQQRRALVLVDSVINSGKTVTEFVQHVRSLSASIKIVVLAGVVQAKVISEGRYALDALTGHGDVSLVALRLSDNKYTGTRGTDTGNRLFNTTHMS